MKKIDPLGTFLQMNGGVHKHLFRELKARRARGLPVDGEWLMSQMRQSVKDSGQTFKASKMWVSKFCKRKGISLQRKTHRKSKSIKERLPKISRFHWYAVYQMATEDP